MADQAESKTALAATMHVRPTVNQLLIAIGVLIGSVVGVLIAGPGFGLLTLTVAVVAAALWIAYGSQAASPDSGAPQAVGARVPDRAKKPLRVPSVAIPSLRKSLDRSVVLSESGLAIVASILIIVVAGGFVLLKNRAINPPGFFADEAEIGVETWRLLHWNAETTRIPFFYQHLEYEHLGTLTLFATAPFVALFGLTDFAVRGSSAFWIIAAAVVIYFTLRRLRVPFAVVPVLTIIFAPLLILVGRVNFGHAPSLLTMAVGYFLWTVARQRSRLGLAFVAGLAIGISAYGQSSYYVAAPLFVLAIGLTELVYNRIEWRSYGPAISLALGSILILLPVPYRAFTDEGFLDRYQDKTAAGPTGMDRVRDWIEMYPGYFDRVLVFERGDGGWVTRHSIPGAPWLLQVVLLLLFIGVVALIAVRNEPSKRYFWPMALILLFYPVPDVVSRARAENPYSYSLVWAIIAVPFVVGYGFLGVQRAAARFKLPGGTQAFAVGAAALLLVGVVGFWRGPFANYPNVSADFSGWQYGAKAATQAFEQRADEYDEFYLSGDFNGAYILPMFFSQGSTIEGRFFAGGLEYLNLNRRQIFAMRVDEWQRYRASQYPSRSYVEIIDTIEYPNGETAFYLLAVQPELLTLGSETEPPAG